MRVSTHHEGGLHTLQERAGQEVGENREEPDLQGETSYPQLSKGFTLDPSGRTLGFWGFFRAYKGPCWEHFKGNPLKLVLLSLTRTGSDVS